jgi:hypothetical protein
LHSASIVVEPRSRADKMDYPVCFGRATSNFDKISKQKTG